MTTSFQKYFFSKIENGILEKKVVNKKHKCMTPTSVDKLDAQFCCLPKYFTENMCHLENFCVPIQALLLVYLIPN